MTTWERGIPDTWDEDFFAWKFWNIPGREHHINSWFSSVLNSSGFVSKPNEKIEITQLNLSPEEIEMVQKCKPLYEEMYAKRLLF